MDRPGCDSEGPSVKRNPKNVDRVVVLDRLRSPLQVGETSGPIKFSDENLGKAGLGRSTPRSSAGPFFRVMDGEGDRVQIPLEVKASFLDELFVFRVVRDG